MIQNFSVWHKKEKRWLNDYDVAITGDGDIYLYGRSLEADGFICRAYDIELMRHTGKHDKNGQVIREGHILRVVMSTTEYDGQFYEQSEEGETKVVYGEVRIREVGGLGLLIRKVIPEGGPGLKRGSFIRIREDKDEIVGHVFENKGLIE